MAYKWKIVWLGHEEIPDGSILSDKTFETFEKAKVDAESYINLIKEESGDHIGSDNAIDMLYPEYFPELINILIINVH